jgi:uncharacterized protein involved in type VI secretion and phage assembly
MIDYDRRYFGVAVALVEEVVGDPAKEGRIKIKFPWYDNKTITEWCRVRHIYGGDGYGAFFVPEKKTEVLVAFLHGHMKDPIILGSLYNGKDKPPSERTDDRDEKVIRTKAGHEILLDDSNNKLKIRIKSKSEHFIELSDQDKKVTIESAGHSSVVIDDSANTVTVKATGGATATLDGKSNQVTLEATTVQLDATTVKLGTGASQSVLLGDVFMKLFASHTHPMTTTGMTGIPTPPIPDAAVLSMITKTG